MRRVVLGMLLGAALTAATGCGLLASAVQNPNIQAFVFETITTIMKDTLEDELENVPFVLEYDHAADMTRTDGSVRDGEHVWMVTVKDKDLQRVAQNGK